MAEYIERKAATAEIGVLIDHVKRNPYDSKEETYGVLCGLSHAAQIVKEKAQAADVVEIPKSGIGDLSDGYHTFNELYHHRAILFSLICNLMPDKAWKSKLHDTGDMYDGMFIVGIKTPQGQATYHYDIDPYWDMFKVKELEKAPEWDGHTPQEAIERISTTLADVAEARHGEWVQKYETYGEIVCSECHTNALLECIDTDDDEWDWVRSNFCPNCGAKMDGKDGAE